VPREQLKRPQSTDFDQLYPTRGRRRFLSSGLHNTPQGGTNVYRHPNPAGWSFIHKGQRYEYPTRQAAQEALYDLQHGKAPASNLLACLDAEEDRQEATTTVVQLLRTCPRDEHFIPPAVAKIMYPLVAARCAPVPKRGDTRRSLMPWGVPAR
jgi:hypothetical protein